MTQQQHENPFTSTESAPAVSWKDAPVGHTIIAKVVELPALVQARDYASGKPAVWDNGDPKMSVVTNVEVDGVKKGLWCVKPSALYGAIVDALQRAGTDALQVGGLLRVQYVGDKPSKAGNPAKQFHVEYKPPSAFDSPGANGAAEQPRYAAPQQPAPGYPPQQDPWGTPPSGQPDPWAGTPKPDDTPPF